MQKIPELPQDQKICIALFILVINYFISLQRDILGFLLFILGKCYMRIHTNTYTHFFYAKGQHVSFISFLESRSTRIYLPFPLIMDYNHIYLLSISYKKTQEVVVLQVQAGGLLASD